MKSKKSETAAELMARLQSDPDWVRRHAELEAKQKGRTEQRLKEIEFEHLPLLAELAAAGVKVRMSPAVQLTLPPEARPGQTPVAVNSVSDLVNTKDSYPEAIPVLVKHLRSVHHPIMVNIIARALTVKEARGTDAARVIIDRLKLTTPSSIQSGDEYQARWALANALTVVADANTVEELNSLIGDIRFDDVSERLKMAVNNLGYG